MTTVVAMLALAVVCWAYRVLFIVVVPASRLPVRARAALGHLAPAVLAAIVVTETHAAAAGSSPLVGAAVLTVVGVLALVAFRTRSLALTVLAGLVAVLVLDLVVLA